MDTKAGNTGTIRRSWAATLTVAALVAGLTLGGIGFAVAATDDAGPDADAPELERPERPEGTEGMRPGHGPGGRLIEDLAEMTGLDAKDIMKRRAGGESLADIAASEGVSTDDILDKILGDVEEPVLVLLLLYFPHYAVADAYQCHK